MIELKDFAGLLNGEAIMKKNLITMLQLIMSPRMKNNIYNKVMDHGGIDLLWELNPGEWGYAKVTYKSKTDSAFTYSLYTNPIIL
jgi:hypothetical protein